jgi:hypothetical protein
VNRTWIVRDGHTGTGNPLFCVYAPTIDTARANAAAELGHTAFSVHAMRAGDTLPQTLTLARNPYTRVDDLARQAGWR